MKDIPIIFSAPMVRALLEGRKTMTRRLALTSRKLMEESKPGRYRSKTKIMDSPWKKVKAGDRLWVRENHQFRGADYGDSGGEIEWFRVYGSGGARDNWDPTYPEGWESTRHMGVHELTRPDEQEGDDVKGYATKLLPSIHMPRWASRLTLIVTGVKVERLQDISDADARAEGVDAISMVDVPRQAAWSARGDFAQLWNKLHGADAWNENPFVVALTFRVIKANIDAPEARLEA